jgi:hypothetical protein
MSDRINQTPPRNGRIGVLYLARAAEGLEPFKRFRDSYLRCPAGIAHDLVVLYKGYGSEAELNRAREVFAGIPHIGLELPDTGFDIGSYLDAAALIEHEYICCINTFTRLLAPEWLQKLHHYASQPDVGIAGSTASYESLFDTLRLFNWASWLCTHDKIGFDPRIAAYYEMWLKVTAADWMTRGLARQKKGWSIKSWFKLRRRRRKLKRRWPKLVGHLAKRWEAYTADGEEMARLRRFPRFPNPHIRSNGFMVRRLDMLSAMKGPIVDKIVACEFESGQDSLTWQLRRRGLRAILVNRDGAGYDVADWASSGTFRLGSQSGLLMADNRTQDFDVMNAAIRATHVWVTWGDYSGPPPRDLPRLGYAFAVDRAKTDPLPASAEMAAPEVA